MSQLLGTQIWLRNEGVTNRSADDGTLDAYPQSILEPPTDGEYCSDHISTYSIFTTYDSVRGITSTIQKRLDKLKLKLKLGKTHCGRGLITDQMAHVVKLRTQMRILNKMSRLDRSPSRCTHLLTPKYGSRVLLATYTGYSFGFISTW